MSEHAFYIDQKMTVWERHKYLVEAESYEEAKRKMIEEFNDLCIGENEGQGFQESEILFDTMENITPEENENQPTVELVNEHNKTILTNYDEPRPGAWKTGGEV